MTRLREIRVAAGLAQSDFARLAGMYCSTVSRLEMAREKAGPSLRARVAEALSKPEAELFDDDGWPLMAEELATK